MTPYPINGILSHFVRHFQRNTYIFRLRCKQYNDLSDLLTDGHRPNKHGISQYRRIPDMDATPEMVVVDEVAVEVVAAVEV